MTRLLMKYLNEQLENELRVMYEYMRLAARLAAPELVEQFKNFCDDEHDHVWVLIDMIRKRGGQPALRMPEVTEHDDLITALVETASRQEAAAQKYSMIATMLEDRWERRLMEDTVRMEWDHHAALCGMLEDVLERTAEEPS